LGMDDVVKLFAQYGSDLTLKNEEGFSIALKNIPVRSEPMVNVQLQSTSGDVDFFQKIANQNCSEQSDEQTIGNRLDNIVKMFTNKSDQDVVDTIGFRRDQISDASYGPTKSKENQTLRVPVLTQSSEKSDFDSIDVLNMIMNDFRQGRQGKQEQQGGGKIINGKRNIVTYSEISIGGKSSNDDSSDLENSDLQSVSSMARAVENKATEAHKRAVERIKELLGVDDIEAKAYKALIYDAIKKDSPQLSNYDKAMELEKRASDKAALKAFSKSDVKNMLKIIEEKHKEHKEHEASSSSATSAKSDKNKKRTKKEQLSEGSSESSGLETISTIEIA